jgi:protein-S-isoprenylcysteine O-methyltransferase Ste14
MCECENMNTLTVKAIANLVKKLVIASVLLFLPAWSMDFWEAWVFLIIFFLPIVLITIYLRRKDPNLLERRLKGGPSAENRISQKVIVSLMNLCFVLMVFLAGMDHRFHWSHIPAFLVIAADVAVLFGFWIHFQALKENSFASMIVTTLPKQTVISTGPYAVIRHPMYSGLLLVDCPVPIALGSWWGLPFAFVILVLIILRLMDEEKLLHQNLSGYDEYCQKVQHRLISEVW